MIKVRVSIDCDQCSRLVDSVWHLDSDICAISDSIREFADELQLCDECRKKLEKVGVEG